MVEEKIVLCQLQTWHLPVILQMSINCSQFHQIQSDSLVAKTNL